MLSIAISEGVDALDYLSMEALRAEARAIDHDCRWQGGDYCPICDLINSADREVVIQIILDN